MEQAYAQALYTAITGGIDAKSAIRALAERLKRESRLGLCPRIAKAFARVAERESAKKSTRLYVAREHDTRKAQEAAATFASVEKHDVSVDETLIGGWRLETHDRLVDASYKKHLLDLFTNITA